MDTGICPLLTSKLSNRGLRDRLVDFVTLGEKIVDGEQEVGPLTLKSDRVTRPHLKIDR